MDNGLRKKEWTIGTCQQCTKFFLCQIGVEIRNEIFCEENGAFMFKEMNLSDESRYRPLENYLRQRIGNGTAIPLINVPTHENYAILFI